MSRKVSHDMERTDTVNEREVHEQTSVGEEFEAVDGGAKARMTRIGDVPHRSDLLTKVVVHEKTQEGDHRDDTSTPHKQGN